MPPPESPTASPPTLDDVARLAGVQLQVVETTPEGTRRITCPFNACVERGIIEVKRTTEGFLWKCLKQGCNATGDAVAFAHRLKGDEGEPTAEQRTGILQQFAELARTHSLMEKSFGQTAMEMAGKSAEEAGRIGAMDKADEQVEGSFRFRTTESPVHRAVWDRSIPVEQLFGTREEMPWSDVEKACERSIALVRGHLERGTLYDEWGKIRTEVLRELGPLGYWGLPIPREYGGLGASIRRTAHHITDMAARGGDATIATLPSVHAFIGAVDPIMSFGSAEQKKRFLPQLASGERLSGFALTEPCAGSDLTALRTQAKLEGDHYIVNGEKLFITNAIPGRTIGLVCMIDGKPQVLIAELPDEETDQFQTVPYGLHPLRRTHNNGLRFKDFPIPKENLIVPPKGDGLTVAYHGLNRGRIAVCACSAGVMRALLQNMRPWGEFRRTYGAEIDKRELVRGRMAELAGRIVEADALVDWGAERLDQGYRGELECIVAKNVGAESLKYAAIELFMRTHGGRSFLHGHIFGDNLYDMLAPSIYEGERYMLDMAFFKALVKQHGMQYFEPIGREGQARFGKDFNPKKLRHAWAVREQLMPYLRWQKWDQKWQQRRSKQQKLRMPSSLRGHANFALDFLQGSAGKLDALMVKHQLKLPDRQRAMTEASQRIQAAVSMLVTAMHAAQQDDEWVRMAADLRCQELTRDLIGRKPGSDYYKDANTLAQVIINGGFEPLTNVPTAPILRPYPQEKKYKWS